MNFLKNFSEERNKTNTAYIFLIFSQALISISHFGFASIAQSGTSPTGSLILRSTLAGVITDLLGKHVSDAVAMTAAYVNQHSKRILNATCFD